MSSTIDLVSLYWDFASTSIDCVAACGCELFDPHPTTVVQETMTASATVPNRKGRFTST
jgi:hypothetical protein